MARLILESGGGRREIRISGPVTIGRSPSATLPLDDKTLSREHTQVYGQGGHYFVKDLDSKNGTFLNGQLLRQAGQLKNGDRIRVGPSVTLLVAFDPQDQPVAKAAPAPPTPARPAARPVSRVVREDVASGGIANFMATVIAIGVFVAGSWFAKHIFLGFLLPMIPR